MCLTRHQLETRRCPTFALSTRHLSNLFVAEQEKEARCLSENACKIEADYRDALMKCGGTVNCIFAAVTSRE